MRGTFGLQWHITDQCDQRCKHCYIWSKRKERQSEQMEVGQCQQIVNDFCAFCADIDCEPTITITGGDPILHPKFWEILGCISRMKIPVAILGNPFHLDSGNLSRMKSLGVAKYQVSLDGLEKTHDYFRKHGSFKATLKAIELINQSGILSMVMSTVSRLNFLEMPEVARLCAMNGVGNYAFARYCSTKKQPEPSLTPEEYRAFLAKMWSTYKELVNSGTNFSLKDHLFTAFLYEEGLFEPKGEKGIIYEGCNCGIRHLTLLPNGDVYACRRFNSLVGKIGRNSFAEIFFSEAMDQYRQFDRFEACSACDLLQYCRGCPAVGASSTNNFYAKDPQCWR